MQSWRGRKGQTLVEYALIIAFVSVVAISVLIAMGGQVKTAFTTISSQLAMANSGGASPSSGPPGHGGGG